MLAAVLLAVIAYGILNSMQFPFKTKEVTLGEKFTLTKGESAVVGELRITFEDAFEVPGPDDPEHPEELGEASYPVALLRLETGGDVVREEFMEHPIDSRRRSITFHDLSLFLVSLRQGVATLQITKETPYRQAVLAFENIKEGMAEKEVLRVMGEPQEKETDAWRYSFEQLEGFPKLAPGVQVFTGGSVSFDEKRKVYEVRLGWIDAAGVAP